VASSFGMNGPAVASLPLLFSHLAEKKNPPLPPLARQMSPAADPIGQDALEFQTFSLPSQSVPAFLFPSSSSNFLLTTAIPSHHPSFLPSAAFFFPFPSLLSTRPRAAERRALGVDSNSSSRIAFHFPPLPPSQLQQQQGLLTGPARAAATFFGGWRSPPIGAGLPVVPRRRRLAAFPPFLLFSPTNFLLFFPSTQQPTDLSLLPARRQRPTLLLFFANPHRPRPAPAAESNPHFLRRQRLMTGSRCRRLQSAHHGCLAGGRPQSFGIGRPAE
jgi:hypothetical protein